MMKKGAFSWFTYLLFAIVVFAWGFSWPLTKMGLTSLSPAWFVAWRFVLATLCLFLYLIAKRQLKLPKKQDLPIIISVGVIQEAFYFLCVTYALVHENVGRASLLVYSTPLWVTPTSILLFKEKLCKYSVIGLCLSLIGFLFLFNPFSLDWADRQILISNGLLILASVCWAVGILHTRYGKWVSPMPVLVAWQTALATSLFVILAFILEPLPFYEKIVASAWPLLYTGIISSGVGGLVGFIVTRRLPVVVTSIALLAVPVIGIISSTCWFHEELTWSVVIAALLIISGICFMTLSGKHKGGSH